MVDWSVFLLWLQMWVAPFVLVAIGLDAWTKVDLIGKTETALKQRWIRKVLYGLAAIVGAMALLGNFGVM